MKPSFKRVIAGLFSLLLVVSAALSLPLVMDRVMAGSLSAQVVFAQEEPEEPAASPSPMPFVMPTQEISPADEEDAVPAAPEPAVLLPVRAPEEGFIPVMPTPMPLESLAQGTSLSQPLPWRNLLIPMAEGEAEVWADKLQALSIAGHPLLQEGVVPNFYLTPGDGPTLMEAIQPREPSLQKLLQGILSNLDSHPIFVPDKQVLGQVTSLPVSSVLLLPSGQKSLFLATGAQRLPLAVISALAGQGKRTAAHSEFTGQRNQMVTEAQEMVTHDPDSAMEKSAALVAEMMHGDTPWELSIIQMTPYSCNIAWEYYLAGHHVKAIDMKTGGQYTLTTDLISARVVGIAEEDAEPWLIAYQKLLNDVEKLANLPPDAMDKAREQAFALGSRLSGIDLKDAAQWDLRVTPRLAGGELPAYWEASFHPLEEETLLMDPSSVFSTYRILMDSDFQLVSWQTLPVPKVSGQGRELSFSDPDFHRKLNQMLLDDFADQEGIRKGIQAALDNLDLLAVFAVEKAGESFPNLTIQEPTTLYLEKLQLPYGKQMTRLILSFTLTGQNGKRLDAALSVDPAVFSPGSPEGVQLFTLTDQEAGQQLSGGGPAPNP